MRVDFTKPQLRLIRELAWSRVADSGHKQTVEVSRRIVQKIDAVMQEKYLGESQRPAAKEQSNG